mmetsp:Transcript_15800/g.44793  ORF Transcript_15800/g.44793 Transcript_15800/m.44793 type:complete len:257 (+) Transcript_15800:981-1751(+)
MAPGTAVEPSCLDVSEDVRVRSGEEFLAHCLSDGKAVEGMGGRAIGEHAALRERRDLTSDPDRRFHHVVILPHDPVHQTHRQCLLCAYCPPSQNHIERSSKPYHSRQTDGPSVNQRHSPPPAKYPKQSPRGCNPQIREKRQFQPTCDAVPINRTQQRFAQNHTGDPHRPIAVHVEPIHPVASLCHRVQIRSGTEGSTVPRQDGYARSRVTFKGEKRPFQSLRSRSVYSILSFYPVKTNDRDKVSLLHHHRLTITPV